MFHEIVKQILFKCMIKTLHQNSCFSFTNLEYWHDNLYKICCAFVTSNVWAERANILGWVNFRVGQLAFFSRHGKSFKSHLRQAVKQDFYENSLSHQLTKIILPTHHYVCLDMYEYVLFIWSIHCQAAKVGILIKDSVSKGGHQN